MKLFIQWFGAKHYKQHDDMHKQTLVRNQRWL